MLVHDVATASADVGATSSRLAKSARIADALALADPHEAAIVVSWLSGELPQRQIGVGWAALRSVPPAAQAPTLTVTGVDATFSEIGATTGKGSQARRAALLRELFSAATEVEQTFLRRLLGGELRQGALLGVMTDAVARAAGLPAPAVRRAAMLGGDLPSVAAAALSGGAEALEAFRLQVGRPVGPMLAQTASDVGDALERLGGTAVFEAKLDGARVQIHRDGRGRRDLHPQPGRRHRTPARGCRGDARAARRDARRRRRGHRAASGQPTAPLPSDGVTVRAQRRHRGCPRRAAAVGVPVRRAAPRRCGPARRAGRGGRRRWPRSSPSATASTAS